MTQQNIEMGRCRVTANGVDLGETSGPVRLRIATKWRERRSEKYGETAVERFCRRRFASASYTEYHEGGGSDRIVLLERPVISVTNVWDDPDREFDNDAQLETDEYTIDSPRGILVLRRGRFFDGTRNVKVSYTAGYGTIPKDVNQAAVLLAAAWFREGRDTAKPEVSDDVRSILKAHREVVV